MYKILALDLDGTILTGKTINLHVKPAIQHVAKHCYVIVTRGHYTADYPCFLENQSIVYMKKMEGRALKSKLSKLTKIYRIKSFSNTMKNTEYIWRFVVEGKVNPLDALSYDSWVQTTFNAEQSRSNRIYFSAKVNTKGSRLAEYIYSNSYRSDQVIAAGDNYNDISILEYAGMGIAIHHADERAKSYADVIRATDNNQNRLTHLINEKNKRII